MKAVAEAVTSGTGGVGELLARARTGEREAFTELVDLYHQQLVRIAYAITGDHDSACDAAQLAWMKAWQRLPSVREPDKLRAWLIAIAANEARQQVRSRGRRRVREIKPVNDEGALDHVGIADPVPAAERLDLAEALRNLDASDRQLLALRYLAGFTAEEIGVAIHLSGAAVRTRLYRLTSRLREELDHD